MFNSFVLRYPWLEEGVLKLPEVIWDRFFIVLYRLDRMRFLSTYLTHVGLLSNPKQELPLNGIVRNKLKLAQNSIIFYVSWTRLLWFISSTSKKVLCYLNYIIKWKYCLFLFIIIEKELYMSFFLPLLPVLFSLRMKSEREEMSLNKWSKKDEPFSILKF